MRATLLVVAVLLGAFRVSGLFGTFDALHPIWTQVFKDTAHLFVGGVIGGAVALRSVQATLGKEILARTSTQETGYQVLSWIRGGVVSTRTFLVRTAVVLSVLETVCAVLSRTVFAR